MFEIESLAPRSAPGLGWLSHVPPPLEGCWFLDNHWDPRYSERTPIGDLLYQAKTYGQKPGERWAAEALARRMSAGVDIARSRGRFPLRVVNVIVSVPANPPKSPHNLPDVLAREVALALNRPFHRDGLVKTRPTPQAKSGHSIAADVYTTQADFRGKAVLIVDDVIHSGRTLAAIARCLRAAGASRVGGYVATYARKGMTI